MDSFLGVKDIRFDEVTKRDLLLFDQIALPDVDAYLRHPRTDKEAADLEWLIDQKLVIPTRFQDLLTGSEAEKLLSDHRSLAPVLVTGALDVLLDIKDVYNIDGSALVMVGSVLREAIEIVLRITASQVEHNLMCRSVPILESEHFNKYGDFSRNLDAILEFFRGLPPQVRALRLGSMGEYSQIPESARDLQIIVAAEAALSETLALVPQGEAPVSVTQLILKSLPLPDEGTPWEKIRDFKSDPAAQFACLQLRQWMKKVATGSISPMELREELNYLLAVYENHMRLHKIKSHAGVIETVLTTTAEFAENFGKFKWGQAARALFSFRQREIALLEAEQDAPGREVAYILKARQEFGGPP